MGVTVIPIPGTTKLRPAIPLVTGKSLALKNSNNLEFRFAVVTMDMGVVQ